MKRLEGRLQSILPQSAFTRSVGVLTGGTAAAQLVTVLSSPLLTRLYTPADLGALSVYAALLSIAGVVASLRYELAIPLPVRDEDAAQVVVLSLVANVAVVTVLGIAVAFFAEPILRLVDEPEIGEWVWLLPVGVLLVGTFQVLHYWAIRNNAFRVVAQAKVFRSIGMVGVQLFAHPVGAMALLVGHVIGQAGGLLSLVVSVVRRQRDVFRGVRAERVVKVAARYRRFPLISAWGGMLNSMGGQLPPILFAALFNPALAGLYGLAHRVLSVPTSLVGEAVADVFLSRASEAHRSGTLGTLVNRLYNALAQFAMPAALVLGVAGQRVFAVVFGSHWSEAGQLAQWLAPMVFFSFLALPLTRLFSVLEKQPQGVVFQVGLFVLRVGGLLLGAMHGDAVMAVALFSLGASGAYVGCLIWAYRVSGNRVSSLVWSTVRAGTSGLVIVGPVWIATLFNLSLTVWAGSVVLSALLMIRRYAVLLRIAK